MTQATARGLYPVCRDGLLFYRPYAFDAYPNLICAIFTRQGGYSQTPFHTLNLSVSVGDDPQTVKKNFAKSCHTLDVSPDQTVSCHLIHSAHILTVNRANHQPVMGQADGLITTEPNIYLAMRFGDCTPLIFFDPGRGAVGLAHAGWRGTIQNVAGAAVREMVRQFGCRPQSMMAVIGPTIGPCCYEVGPEVIAGAQQAFSEVESLFVQRNGKADHAHFNLWEANRRQLAAAGVGQIIQSELCTACRTDEFFSHRAERGWTGRFGVIVGLKGEIG